MVTGDDVRAFARTLPRMTEAYVHDRWKARIGSIVWAALSRDEAVLGFAFPKEERDALVHGEPDKFLLPRASDLRYRWVCVRLAAIDEDELHELLLDAWRMCVPKKVSAAYDGQNWPTETGP